MPPRKSKGADPASLRRSSRLSDKRPHPYHVEGSPCGATSAVGRESKSPNHDAQSREPSEACSEPVPDDQADDGEHTATPESTVNGDQDEEAMDEEVLPLYFQYFSKNTAKAEELERIRQCLECPKCKEPLREPLFAACGHTFCSDCFTEAMKRQLARNTTFQLSTVLSPMNAKLFLRRFDLSNPRELEVLLTALYPMCQADKFSLILMHKCPVADCRTVLLSPPMQSEITIDICHWAGIPDNTKYSETPILDLLFTDPNRFRPQLDE
ncbi:hypothetical protein BDN72DRAFT_906814 [Pluteus cervinus]|uniref:Uncharacterized protein n=1 Tax=Pluteus cervinus TaxID=181527 RepID=A0ACD2ZYD7_9AGAR|nr:hypothetical protein BDN72DRAFT_906814 [Pluteus cervinus]